MEEKEVDLDSTRTEMNAACQILYDLNTIAEWNQEAENAHKLTRETTASTIAGRTVSVVQRSFWTFLRVLGFPQRTSSPCNLPGNLVKLTNLLQSWSICLSPDGECLAVLQQSSVEILSKQDGFSSIIGKANVKEDSYPQWRCMTWSEDDFMLAVSSSDGAVQVFDMEGGEFFTIEKPETSSAVGDLSCAVTSMIFMKPSKSQSSQWDVKLLVVNYQGLLQCHLINTVQCTHKLDHTFLFSWLYPRGISTVTYSSQHSMLIVAGPASMDSSSVRTDASQDGITAWRLLSDKPHYKMVIDYDQSQSQGLRHGGVLSKVRNAFNSAIYGVDLQRVVTKTSLSPDGKFLLVLDSDSRVSLFHVPSLQLFKMWKLIDQPCSDVLSPTLEENSRKSKILQDTPHYQYILDTDWWSNGAIILARYSGAVLVADIDKLTNLLGENPEWFDLCPQVQRFADEGFLSLECECRVLPTRKRTQSESSIASGADDSDEDSEASSLGRKANRVLSDMMYYVTDLERFAPPKKRPKLIKKIYRLVSLKPTTPEELFSRKIDQEEYGEALALAKVYKLDSDLVHQRQWRKSKVSRATIQDYLSKISKRSWVLHECLERVPDDLDAMRDLLQYGLKGTDLEALISIGQGKDQGRFTLSDDEALYHLEESIDEFDHNAAAKIEEAKRAHRNNLLSQVNFDRLSMEQKELCRVRLKLLQYLDRLSTYEDILGGSRRADEHYDFRCFEKFRSQNVLEAISDYARAGDWKAVDVIFIYLGHQTLNHRLAILSNFPETLRPKVYKSLLPMVDGDSVVPYHQESLRQEDWCESNRLKFELKSNQSADFLYGDDPQLAPFADRPLTPCLLSDWYQLRACDIEAKSHLVDYARELVEIGMQHYVDGLGGLRDDLIVMEMIVYDCLHGDSLSFADLRKMTDLDRLKVIMSKSTINKYAVHIQKWMKPFLEICESKNSGSSQSLVSQYLVDLARDDLQLVFKVFECSKAVPATVHTKVLANEEQLLSCALDCIYACERDDQLSYILSILECLPHRKLDSKMGRSLIKLHNSVDSMELHINAAEILEKYGIKETISSIKASQFDVAKTTLLMKKLTRRANNRSTPLNTSEWAQLQSDMAALQSKVYRCIDEKACQEIFVESLLCSGKKENISLADAYLETSDKRPSEATSPINMKLSFAQSVDIAVRASMEYFNASGSADDLNMILARSCLDLFKSPHSSLRKEMNLIEALPLLNDFGVTTLPLHVRLTSHKLDLVKEALYSGADNYKLYPKLLKLAEYMDTSESDSERDGSVLRLIIQKALDQSDYRYAYKHCSHLMEKEYPDIWQECYKLAICPGFSNADAKMALLSYALVHCSDELIEAILKERMLLKTQILMSRIGISERKSLSIERHCTPSAARDTVQEQPDEATTEPKHWHSLFTPDGAVGALAQTTKSTKALFSSVGDMKWLDKTVSMISRQSTRKNGTTGNADFTKQGCHPFYEDVIPTNYLDFEIDGDDGLKMSVAEDVLRTSKLRETLTEGETCENSSQVMIKCAQHILPKDITLGLGFLLALSKECDAEVCFRDLPQIPLTLTLGCYYYALQLAAELGLSAEGTVSETIDLITENVQQRARNLNQNCQELMGKLEMYKQLMDDHGEALHLQTLGCTVDGHRFTADDNYKKEIALDLARTTNHAHYKTALTLAYKYNIDSWEVLMTHTEYLFTKSGWTTAQIQKRLSTYHIIEKLSKDTVNYAQRMYNVVRPAIEGTDLKRLQLYYSLISNCSSHEAVDAETHCKLLSKLIPAAPGLNYGALIQGEGDAIDIIRPVLKSGNVYVFSKLSSKIPKAGDGFLSSSSVFTAWAQKLFFDGSSEKSKVPESTAAWLHRYEACSEFIHKMTADDNVNFIKHVLFTPQALDMVPLEARKEICKRDIKFCQGNSMKGIQKQGKLSWSEASNAVCNYKDHLDKMSAESLIALHHAEDNTLRSYHRQIDACMGDIQQLKQVLVKMLLDGQALELVSDILGVIPVDDWTVRDALSEAIKVICEHLREKKVTLPNSLSTMEVFSSVIAQVAEHQKEGGVLVNSEDVMSLFRPLIPDTSIDIQTRLDALELIQTNFDLSEGDSMLVIAYQTEAIVITHWINVTVNIESLKTEDGRKKLFSELVASSETLEQFGSIPKIFRVWPTSKNTSEMWMWLLDSMLAKVDIPECAELITNLCLQESVSQGVIQKAYSTLKSKDYYVEASLLALRSSSPLLLDDVAELMSRYAPDLSDQDKLLNTVFELELVVHFVDTPVFPLLVTHLQKHQNETEYLSTQKVMRQLIAANRQREAQEVDKQCSGRSQGLVTLDAAVGAMNAIGRWWKKN